jgi:hypothetical protein
MPIANQYPIIDPSLLLDFANVKKLDPRITFTRAATAKYYDGVTSAKAEENLIPNSEDVTGSGWSLYGMTSTANTTAAPDGNTTADTIANTAITDFHTLIASATSLVASQTYTVSCFIKKGTVRYVALAIYNASNNHAGACFDLDLGTATAAGAIGTGFSASNATITSVGNSWYRCSVTCVNGSSNPAATARVIHRATSYASGSLVESYAGNTTDTTYVWGFQVEQRSAVTAYTPTTTQAITNYIPVLQTAASGEARFDHDPVTRESLGLLIEESRTNLLVRSEEFNDGAWTKTRSSVTANSVVAPDGALTGDTFIPSTDLGSHILGSVSIAFGASLPVCGSVYFKAGGYSRLRVRLGQSSGLLTDVIADANTGTLIAGTTANSTITPVGNGWFRFSVFGTTGVGNTAVTLQLWAYDNSAGFGQSDFAGNGYSGIYIWGAQLEAGSFATSYIPTTSAQVTRAADAASMTGTNFSSWYRADEGTIYTEFKANAASVGQSFASIDDGTTGNAIYLITSPSSSGSDRFQVNVSGVLQAALGASGFVATNTNKMSGAYKVNDFSRVINGGTALTDASGNVPVVTALRIGNQANINFLNGTMKKLAYYPKRLTNTQLQALTL